MPQVKKLIYQVTFMDDNYQPLNQISSLQLIRQSETSDLSLLGEPIQINATEYQSIKVLESMKSISVNGTSQSVKSFRESFDISHKQSSVPEVENITNKSTLRVNMEFSNHTIYLDEPNVTVTLRLMDTEDETYLGGNCVLELTHPEDSDGNNSKVFQIPLNQATGGGQVTINAIKELNIISETDFNQTSNNRTNVNLTLALAE